MMTPGFYAAKIKEMTDRDRELQKALKHIATLEKLLEESKKGEEFYRAQHAALAAKQMKGEGR